jgi:hypothetical protein
VAGELDGATAKDSEGNRRWIREKRKTRKYDRLGSNQFLPI